jgi:hypothetical protein
MLRGAIIPPIVIKMRAEVFGGSDDLLPGRAYFDPDGEE